MTQRKPRSIEPYTNNLVAYGLGDFPGLDQALLNYFNESVCKEISQRIFDLVSTYGIEIQINQDRKISREQRKDRHELIETMKELNMRLFPSHIPTPLYEPARIRYTPNERGKPTLTEEISDLLLRLRHLQHLFESIKVPSPTKTNPGKPERDRLVKNLGDIFDDFSSNLKHSDFLKHLDDTRMNFIGSVFKVFNMKDPVPRNT